MSQLAAETSGVKRKRKPGPNHVAASRSDADADAIKAKKEAGTNKLAETSGVKRRGRAGLNPVAVAVAVAGTSQSAETSGVERRGRAGAGPNRVAVSLSKNERTVLEAIKAKANEGTWVKEIERETELSKQVVKKSLESLLNKDKIKLVSNVKFKKQEQILAKEFEPSKAITGGVWYTDGSPDKELIDLCKKVMLEMILKRNKVATADEFFECLKNLKQKDVLKFSCSKEEAGDFLNDMVLNNDIIEVKSTGLGVYHSIPVGKVCYRAVSGGVKTGPMASIPCGMCQMISRCTPDGVISPAKCMYYKQWTENLDWKLDWKSLEF